ncbi:MAG: serine hydrolase [Bacillota bacterium]
MPTDSKLPSQIEDILSSVDGTIGLWAQELRDGETLAWNEDEPFPAASIIKIPIMVEVFRQAQAGLLSLDRSISLSPEDQVGGSGVLQLLSPGIALPVRDLVALMIDVSDNSATNLLVDLVGAEAVTATMHALGLTGTYLYNKLMVVPVERPGNNATTPRDMGTLLVKLARGEVISYDACRRMVEILKRQQFNDILPARLPPAYGNEVGGLPRWVMAHKTGMIAGCRHDVGLVYTSGRTWVVSAFSKGLTDAERGVQALGDISRLLYDHWAVSR